MCVNRPTLEPAAREKQNSGNKILNISMRRAILSFVKLFLKKQSTIILYHVMKFTVAKIDEQRIVNLWVFIFYNGNEDRIKKTGGLEKICNYSNVTQ